MDVASSAGVSVDESATRTASDVAGTSADVGRPSVEDSATNTVEAASVAFATMGDSLARVATASGAVVVSETIAIGRSVGISRMLAMLDGERTSVSLNLPAGMTEVVWARTCAERQQRPKIPKGGSRKHTETASSAMRLWTVKDGRQWSLQKYSAS